MPAERSSKKITWTRENVGYRVLANGRRSYCYRYRDADGIQRCMFLGAGSTERQAVDALAGVTVAASKGDAVRVSREPFAAFADRWLEDRTVDLAPTTAATYRGISRSDPAAKHWPARWCDECRRLRQTNERRKAVTRLRRRAANGY